MKLKEQKEARKLRQQGLSLKQISEKLKVSKGSVSMWVRDVKLSTRALNNIKNQRRRGWESSRETTLAKRAQERSLLYEKCKSEILPLSTRDLWIAGLMLYAGEGRKVWNASSQPIELTSSEPAILRIFLNFLAKACHVNRREIKIRLFLYPDIDLTKAQKFWSRELHIPTKQFQKPFIKHSYSNPSRSRRSDYGTVHIVLNNAKLYRKIMGWLQAIYEHNK